MSMTLVDLQLEIGLRSALHVGTGFGLAQILDDRIVQQPHGGEHPYALPYVPGSSLKGRLRHHARELLALLPGSGNSRRAVETRLFGFQDTAGLLTYDDAHLDPHLAATVADAARAGADQGLRGERAFVSLSRERRVALEQRLFKIEVADPDLVFVGRIHGWLPDAAAPRDLALLAAALRRVTHLGGHKGRGLGLCRITLVAADPEIPDLRILEQAP